MSSLLGVIGVDAAFVGVDAAFVGFKEDHPRILFLQRLADDLFDLKVVTRFR